MLERHLHRAVAEHLARALTPPAWWTTIGHGGFQADARTMARMKAAGVRAGVPDLLIVSGGVAHFIELKSETGEVRPHQRAVHADLVRAGAHCAVCRSLDDVQRMLDNWGVPLRARLI